MSFARRAAAFAVALALVAFAPGLAPYEAAAQVFEGAAAASPGAGASGAAAFGSGPAALPVLPPAAALAPALSSILPTGSAPAVSAGAAAGASALPALAPAAAPALTALPVSAITFAAGPAAAPSVPTFAVANPAVAVSPVSAVADAAVPASAPTPALPQLSAAAQDLGQAQAGAQAGLLDQLFTGARRALGLDAAVPAAATFSAPAAEPAAAPVPGLERATAPVPLSLSGTGLQPGEPLLSAAFTPQALESRAVDSTLPLDQRQSALALLSSAYNPGLRGLTADGVQVLQRVAAANPQGGADDYEIHRAALRALAEQGVVESLRPISRLQADQILTRLSADKPAAAVFDYDDTLAPFREPISPEVAAGLAAARDAGVRAAILTDRPDQKKSERDVTIVDSLAAMTPAQKAGLLVGADSGARLLAFDAEGAPTPARDAGLRFTDAQRAAIAAASAATAEKFGRYEYNGKEENLGDFKWVRFLPLGMPAQTVQDAAAFLQAQLDRAGANVAVSGRQAADPKNPSYLTISLLDKSVGIKALRAAFARDGVETAAAESMLIVGDSFFGTRTVDSDMSRAAPGALTIAVGGVADPRIDNAFVWPTKGREASLELLTALGRPVAPTALGRLRALAASALARLGRLIGWDAPSPPAPGPDEPINGKTLSGLILQSVPSMAAYMLVTLAFVAVAVPVVGWPGYGILMSLSPMAGIAAANVMGQVVRRMSARDAMALNTLLRVASLSALPLFHLFGVVNFGTLLVGALAEGWLLSSIMTTQSSFLRVLFPAKQLGNINGAIMLMFPAVQTVLGLFLGVGRLADVVSPYAIFAGAAAINLALVPLIWKTIPNIKLMQDAPAADAAPKQPLRSRAAAFARRYWKEAALLAAAVAYFAGAAWLKPAFATSLPIAGALVYWITRTDAFRALRSGASREVADGEKAAATDAERAVYRRRQFKTVMLLALSTLMYYPLYLVAAPHIAELLAGSAHKIELTSQFLGALFFGGMISISGRTKLPDVRIPLPGGRSYTVGAHRIIQAAVVAMAGLWMFTKMFPGSVPIALAGAAAAAGLIALAGRVTDRGWIKMVGVGFAAVWLPFVVWTWPALIPFLTVKMAMSLAMLAAGLVSGPNGVSLYTYLYRSTQARESSRVGGLQGAFFNAAISAGYALLTIASGFLNPAYPAVLAALGVVNLLVGAAFWRAPKSLPGLAPTILERRSKPARAANDKK